MYAPYSPKVKKNENTLCFTLPGFKSHIYVPFTGRRLAVCERCKKNFKTRDHCRTRDCHVDLPWSETFVCVSLDPSCTDEEGKLVDGPFFARAVTPMAFHYEEGIDKRTPICSPCKDKNYTRNYCRLQKRHLQLPWSTVYVILSLKPDNLLVGDFNAPTPESPARRRSTGSTVTKPGRGKEVKGVKALDDDDDDEDSSDDEEIEKGGKPRGNQDKGDDDEDEAAEEDSGDEVTKSNLRLEQDAAEAKKMENIPPSRTFLATISCKNCTIQVSL